MVRFCLQFYSGEKTVELNKYYLLSSDINRQYIFTPKPPNVLQKKNWIEYDNLYSEPMLSSIVICFHCILSAVVLIKAKLIEMKRIYIKKELKYIFLAFVCVCECVLCYEIISCLVLLIYIFLSFVVAIVGWLVGFGLSFISTQHFRKIQD